jgi:RNA polymerase sigma-70 factor, ECF subfamily
MQDLPRDIIIQAAKGDMYAFERIYTAMNAFVFNVAFRIAGNKEDAKEITQDVFIKLHRKLSGFMFQSSFKTWVYRITANTAINTAKSSKRHTNNMLSFDEDIRLKEHVEGQRPSEAENNDPKLLDRLLNSLDANHRACIVLRSVEGLSYKEISESLNININTVRTRLKRARESMMKNFHKGGQAYEVQKG